MAGRIKMEEEEISELICKIGDFTEVVIKALNQINETEALAVASVLRQNIVFISELQDMIERYFLKRRRQTKSEKELTKSN